MFTNMILDGIRKVLQWICWLRPLQLDSLDLEHDGPNILRALPTCAYLR